MHADLRDPLALAAQHTSTEDRRTAWWRQWRWVVANFALLVFLGMLVSRVASSQLKIGEVNGSYSPSVPWTLDGHVTVPQVINLEPDGTLTLRSANGTVQRCHWWWEGDEGWMRSDLHEMDQRIRGYRSWAGPVLYFRCAVQMNRPEEVLLERTD